MDICGSDPIYIPKMECDDCAAFLTRVQRVEQSIDYLDENKQNTLTAGENITIIGDTISATGGGAAYTAGDNIDITNDKISLATSPELKGTPTAPTNTTVTDNTDQIATTKFVQTALKNYESRDLYAKSTGTQTVPNATDTFIDLSDFAADKRGVYVGFIRVWWSSNANGRRLVEITRVTPSTGATQVTQSADARSATSGGATVASIPVCQWMETGDYLRVKLWQNSGGSLTITSIQVRLWGWWEPVLS